MIRHRGAPHPDLPVVRGIRCATCGFRPEMPSEAAAHRRTCPPVAAVTRGAEAVARGVDAR